MTKSAFFEKLNQLDFSLVIDKLTSKKYGLGWSKVKVQKAIDGYKIFLYLQFVYPHIPLSPTSEIDEVWHTHILVDTYQYIQDCQNLYGYILHHRFSEKGSSDNLNLNLIETKTLFEKYLGANILGDTDFDTAPCVDLPICPHLPNHLSACMTLPIASSMRDK